MRFDTKFDQYLRSKEKAARRGTVRIENPLPGGATRLKADVALRHVQRGAAEWTANGKGIRFRDAAVDRVMRAYQADRAIHSGLANYQAIKHLPCTKPVELLAPSKQRHFWSKKSVHTAVRRTRPQR